MKIKDLKKLIGELERVKSTILKLEQKRKIIYDTIVNINKGEECNDFFLGLRFECSVDLTFNLKDETAKPICEAIIKEIDEALEGLKKDAIDIAEEILNGKS